MTLALVLGGALAAAGARPGAGQQQHEHRHEHEEEREGEPPDAAAGAAAEGETRSPYAGQEGREIKALSREEVRGLLEGEGMGLAMAAELNGLPGPRHVLDLAAALELDDGQRTRVREVFRRMRERAVALGEEILERERALDRRFAAGTADSAGVEAAALEIGTLRGRLRAAHLVAHLATTRLLTDAQVRRYARLRGYSTEEGAEP